MVEPKLTFFQMQVEGTGRQAAKANQASFCVSPETFNAVDVVAALGKFVLAMIDTKVFSVAHINQAVIATPAVRINDAFEFYFTAYNCLQRGLGAIWNDLGIDVTVPLKDAEDDRFTKGTTTSFTLDAPCAEERFVHFNLSRKGRLGIAIFGQALPNFGKITIDSITI